MCISATYGAATSSAALERETCLRNIPSGKTPRERLDVPVLATEPKLHPDQCPNPNTHTHTHSPLTGQAKESDIRTNRSATGD